MFLTSYKHKKIILILNNKNNVQKKFTNLNQFYKNSKYYNNNNIKKMILFKIIKYMIKNLIPQYQQLMQIKIVSNP